MRARLGPRFWVLVEHFAARTAPGLPGGAHNKGGVFLFLANRGYRTQQVVTFGPQTVKPVYIASETDATLWYGNRSYLGRFGLPGASTEAEMCNLNRSTQRKKLFPTLNCRSPIIVSWGSAAKPAKTHVPKHLAGWAPLGGGPFSPNWAESGLVFQARVGHRGPR